MNASSATASYSPDGLIAGHSPVITKTGTLLSGAGALLRGTLLGAVLLGSVSTAFAGVGNGTITMDVTTPVLANAQPGAYVAKCITATTNSGTFRVFDPKGNALGDVVVGATFANQIKFVIADGGTDFDTTAIFTITVAAGSKKYKKSLAAATDGSQYPSAVLVADTDATSSDKQCGVYLAAEFDETAVIYGAGHTADSVRDALRLFSMYLKNPLAA